MRVSLVRVEEVEVQVVAVVVVAEPSSKAAL